MLTSIILAVFDSISNCIHGRSSMLTSVRYSETGRSTSFAELKSNTGSGCTSKSYDAQNPSEENQTPDTQAIALEGSHPFYPKCHHRHPIILEKRTCSSKTATIECRGKRWWFRTERVGSFRVSVLLIRMPSAVTCQTSSPSQTIIADIPDPLHGSKQLQQPSRVQ